MPDTKLSRPLLTLLAAALPAFVVPGCHADAADVDPSERAAAHEDETREGRRVEFALEPGAVDPKNIELAARHVETLADVAAAKASVRMGDDDATVVSVELWGANFPSDKEIEAAMRAEFPFLKDAIITVVPLEDSDAPPALDHGTKEEDPEAVRARIIEDLRAKGVEGEITVDVVDTPDGERSIEVHVEKDEDVGPDAFAADPE